MICAERDDVGLVIDHENAVGAGRCRAQCVLFVTVPQNVADGAVSGHLLACHSCVSRVQEKASSLNLTGGSLSGYFVGMKLFGVAFGFVALACVPVQPRPRADAGPFLRIIGTNDFHGALEPRADSAGVRLGGAAYMAAAIRAAAAECAPGCEVLLLDGGDMFQGTPASNTAYGKPVVELYNELGYAAAALGNHEFDWGIDTLRARMADARFNILGANVRYADGRDVEWIPNDTIVVRGRARIGIIGLSTQQTPTATRPQNVAHLRFVDPAPVVDAHARSLRARGATHVVIVGHVGGHCGTTCEGEIFDFANRITEPVDAIVSGHSHSLLNTTVRGVPIVQARSSGRAIDVLDVPLDRSSPARGDVRPVLTAQITPDPAAAAIVARWTALVAGEFSRPVGNLSERLSRAGVQHSLGNLIANAHVSGASIVYSRDSAGAGRIDTVLVAGRPIEDSASYTVSINDFMAAGGDGLAPPASAVVQALPIIDRNALRDYLTRLPQPVEAPRTVRIRPAGESTP